MSNISLYNIRNKFVELFEKAENEELTEEELNEQGNELAIELKNKSTSIIAYTKQLELTSQAVKSEIERLTALKKAIDNKNDRFKGYVKTNMEALGLQKVETPLGIINVAKNPPSIEVYAPDLVEDEYKESKVTITINKLKIKEALKAGKNVQGARLVEDKTSLRIK